MVMIDSQKLDLGGFGGSGSGTLGASTSAAGLFPFAAAGPTCSTAATSTTASMSVVWRAAADALLSPELLALIEDGLGRQLQRTKDGATEGSRIQELAGGRAGKAVDACNGVGWREGREGRLFAVAEGLWLDAGVGTRTFLTLHKFHVSMLLP
jgi:hypothetical protein